MATDLLSYIPTAFPALALAHFLALLSPGPDHFSARHAAALVDMYPAH